jgi:hypothetical protein
VQLLLQVLPVDAQLLGGADFGGEVFRSAALLTDLGFFVFRVGTTAPAALWILGLAFGLALMGAAAWIEFKREGVLQQIRVFGRELEAW